MTPPSRTGFAVLSLSCILFLVYVSCFFCFYYISYFMGLILFLSHLVFSPVLPALPLQEHMERTAGLFLKGYQPDAKFDDCLCGTRALGILDEFLGRDRVDVNSVENLYSWLEAELSHICSVQNRLTLCAKTMAQLMFTTIRPSDVSWGIERTIGWWGSKDLETMNLIRRARGAQIRLSALEEKQEELHDQITNILEQNRGVPRGIRQEQEKVNKDLHESREEWSRVRNETIHFLLNRYRAKANAMQLLLVGMALGQGEEILARFSGIKEQGEDKFMDVCMAFCR